MSPVESESFIISAISKVSSLITLIWAITFSISFVLDLNGYEIGSILTKGNDGHIRGLEREIILDLTKEIQKVIANIRVKSELESKT